MDAELQKMHRSHHRRRVSEMQLFLRDDLPVLLDVEPPKAEPAEPPEIVALRDSWRDELPIVNPYVPLAHRK